MLTEIIEQERSTPIVSSTDVLVAGGGIAGISAALAAARHGKKVILLEREFAVGGMATLGLISIYLPLCDGMGNQVVFGQGEELLRLSIKDAYEGEYPHAWLGGGSKEDRINKRFVARFNPQFFALDAEALLLNSGVRIIYGTSVVDTVVENGFITQVIVENKSGRSAINVESVIDCTGDADICYLSGAPTALKENGNGLASWYYYFDGQDVQLKMFGLADVVPERKESASDQQGEYSSAAKTDSLDADFRFSGVDGYELSEAVIAGHKKMHEDILAQKRKNDAIVPVTISTIPLVRMSRRLVGVATMEKSADHCHVHDSVGMTGDWCNRGPVYEIPFRALYCSEIKNLLVAGRDVSASDAMWNVMRVIPPCAVTGQAAGTAAALTNEFETIDLSELQRILVSDGVKLHHAD